MLSSHKDKNQGFALIGLLIVVAIIAIVFVMYYGKSGDKTESVQQTGQRAIEKTKENNASEIQNHLEIQNELNSIDR